MLDTKPADRVHDHRYAQSRLVLIRPASGSRHTRNARTQISGEPADGSPPASSAVRPSVARAGTAPSKLKKKATDEDCLSKEGRPSTGDPTA